MHEQFCQLPEEKRLNIVYAAMEVFAHSEYKRAVTDDIAARAGISKGLLFYYFGHKKALYLYVFDYTNGLIRDYVLDSPFSELTDFFELLDYATEKK